jgi:hypothetical protein
VAPMEPQPPAGSPKSTALLLDEVWVYISTNRLKMRRWWFPGLRGLRGKFKPRFRFQQWNKGQSWYKKQEKAHIWMSFMLLESQRWYQYPSEVKI